MYKRQPFTLAQGSLDTEISDIIYDSRKAAPGLLFVCIVGTQRDSHEFAADCAAKGVSALVIQHDIDLSAMPGVTVVKVESSRYAMALMLSLIHILAQGLMIAYKAENQFCTMVGIGIMAQIAWQVFCNIAVVTNTIPNTGISLPFFSSGGTSLISVSYTHLHEPQNQSDLRRSGPCGHGPCCGPCDLQPV